MNVGHTLALIEQSIGGSRAIELSITELVIAGWTGRDAKAVQNHIRELQELGVSPPRQTPVNGGIAFAERMTLELHDPMLGRSITHEYAILPLPAED